MRVELWQLLRRYAELRIEAPSRRSRLMTSLARDGQQMPVVVVPADGAEQYVLIDGYLRVAALEQLGRDEVEAVVVHMPEGEALVWSHRLDPARRRTSLEEGWLLRELEASEHLSYEQLATRLGRSKSWVSRRLSLVRTLPEAAQEAVRRGQLSAQVATKYLVPLARANAGQCTRLVEGLGSSTPTVRQMARLYAAWRSSDAEGRDKICARPQLYLKAKDELAQEREHEREAALLRDDLRTLSSVCSRAQRRLDDGVLERLDPKGRRQLMHAFEQARLGFGGLHERLQEREDARSGDADGDLAAVS